VGRAGLVPAGEWDFGRGISHRRESLTVYGPDLIAAGSFTQAGDVSAINIARWNGAIWRRMTSGIGAVFFQTVTALAVQNGSLYAGGSGGAGSAYIARWNGTTVPVKLLSFSVQRAGATAQLTWRVADDLGLVGFHVYRQEPGGDRLRISDRLFTGQQQDNFTDPDPPESSVAYWLSAVERGGAMSWFGPWWLPATDRTPVVQLTAAPNPFKGQVRIGYELSESSAVAVDVLDVQGRRVFGWSPSAQGAGNHELTWDGRTFHGQQAAAGGYFVRVHAGGQSAPSA
jgi:hypothetical protein